ncbi:TonB-linked SusC/RagA family outer membrane protein [Wenyingzhuangia heitensis]|uniref:TonB-linked SusC/RagA family outer membrane protein n=1 Tax=Wenyingzhuangia heitensis TaxID=1487859 RepID=A0ABX0U9K4_9FLAO|nr:TonB-dependent receptor [Wenyingzhuangia heitensis]NIJ44630.1 TonB-linked SusC/RagA family outer membrane protein [Wenyingzhuangia heitensis]
MKKLIYLIPLLMISFFSYSQEKNVVGIITDLKTGDVLPGVSVLVKGTTKGTYSNFDGEYKLSNITNGQILKISYLGYTPQEITVASSNLDIQLEEDIESLSEVVVIGYGTQKKKEVTGAVSVVNAEVIEALNPTRVEQALQGQVSGVNITSTSGAPGSGMNIRIRGVSTNGDSRPLILVDGNPITDLSVINPNDIKSVNVLKDATAGIYGVRAANGVILIETKTGSKKSDLKFNLTANYSLQQTSNELDLLDAKGLAAYVNEATGTDRYFIHPTTGLVYDTNVSAVNALPNTDWQNEVFELAPSYDVNLTASGGTEKLAYSFGTSFLSQDGIVGGDKSNYNRFTARTNLQYDVTDKLKLAATAIYTRSQKNKLQEGGIGAVLYNAINADPFTLPVDPTPLADVGFEELRNGYGIVQTGAIEVSNPLSQMASTYDTDIINKISPTISAEYSFTDHLSVKSKYLMNHATVDIETFRPLVFMGQNKSLSRINNNEYVENVDTFDDYTWNNIITYQNTFNDVHNLTVLLGHEMVEFRGKYKGQTGIGLKNGDNTYEQASIANSETVNPRYQPADIESGANQFKNRLQSVFTRLQYNYKEKYLVSAVFRRDASSKFNKGNNVGYFPSISLGWNLSDEAFLKDHKNISSLKLRGSYGTIGNDRIDGDFPYVGLLDGEGTYSTNEEDEISDLLVGVAEGKLGNPSLKWETTTTANFGIDLSLLKNRLTFTADVFKKVTDDLLISAESSALTGVAGIGSSAPFINAGSVENSGVEFLVSYRDQLSKDFKFNASLNFATLKNEVTYVGNLAGFEQGGAFGVGTGIVPSRMEAGHALGYFYGYKTNGIYQNQAEIDALNANAPDNEYHSGAGVGDLKFVDTNGDGVISEEDKTDIGDPIADLTAGLNLGFTYKNIDFSASAIGSFGNEMVRDYERLNLLANKSTRVLDRWTPTNPSNTVPRATTGASINTDLFSDYYVEDASYIRIQNVQIGYNFDKKILEKIGVDRARLFLSANNLHTFTDYSGYDPSASGSGTDGKGDPIGAGIDRGFYPVATTYILGLNLTF